VDALTSADEQLEAQKESLKEICWLEEAAFDSPLTCDVNVDMHWTKAARALTNWERLVPDACVDAEYCDGSDVSQINYATYYLKIRFRLLLTEFGTSIDAPNFWARSQPPCPPRPW